MAHFQFILELFYWYLKTEVFRFEWDQGNSSKSLSKHGVDVSEVESVFSLKMGIPIGRQVEPEVGEERLCVIGPSQTGNILSIVFTMRGQTIRPISSRPASRKERRLYEEIRQKIKNL